MSVHVMKILGPLIVLVGLISLSGCSREESDRAEQPKLFPALQVALASRRGPKLDPGYLALSRTNTAGMFTFAQDSGQSTLLREMAVSNHGVNNWLSPAGTIFSFRDGMLIATRGLGDDIMSTDASQTMELLRARQPGEAKRFVSHLDGNNQIVQSAFICDVAVVEPFLLDLNTHKVQTTYMTETCHGEDYGFLNLFWVDAQGKIQMSRQYTGKLVGLMLFRGLAPSIVTKMSRGVLEAAEKTGDAP